MSTQSQKTNTHQSTGLTRITKPRKGWHRADIKAALEKRGWTMAALSVAHGYDRTTAGKALSHYYPSVERIIADTLGKQPWALWPERYNDYGQPIQEGNPNMVKRSWGGRKRNVELTV